MRKITLVLCSVLVGFTISAAQNDWEEAVEEIRDELRKSMEEIQELKERLHEDGLPSFRGLDAFGTQGRASLGVFLNQNNDQDLIVLGFSQQSNARDSGVEQGDVLIAIDAQDLTGDAATSSTVIEYLESIEPGTEVILTVRRGDEELQYTVQTHSHVPAFGWIERRFGDHQNRPFFEYREERTDRNGSWLDRIPWANLNRHRGADSDVEVTDLNPELGNYFGVESGVLVLRAGDESALVAGDVIVAVGDQDVANSQELYEQLKNGTGSVSVRRDGKTIELTIDETLEGLRLEREVRIFSRRLDGSSDRQVW